MSSVALTISIAVLLFLLPAQSTPIHHQPHLHCRCESPAALSGPQEPSAESEISSNSLISPCALRNVEWLDWRTAAKFADEHGIPLHFESRAAASKILEQQQPLPTGVLMALSPEPPADEPSAVELHSGEEWVEEKSRIVCSLDDRPPSWISEGLEAEEGRGARELDPGCDGKSFDLFVVQVVLWLLLVVVVYEAAEVIYIGVRRRFAPKESTIRLSGDEKELKAEKPEQQSQSPKVQAIRPAPALMAQDTPQPCGRLDVIDEEE